MRHEPTSHNPPQQNLLTTQDVAHYLNCSRRTIERIVARGDLRPLHVGAHRRFRLEDIDAYAEQGSP